MRILAVWIWVGATIAGVDLLMGAILTWLTGRPNIALLLNCLTGVGLSFVTLHPRRPTIQRRLVRVLARRRFGRLVLRMTSVPPRPLDNGRGSRF
jgi:hypothetical protein